HRDRGRDRRRLRRHSAGASPTGAVRDDRAVVTVRTYTRRRLAWLALAAAVAVIAAGPAWLLRPAGRRADQAAAPVPAPPTARGAVPDDARAGANSPLPGARRGARSCPLAGPAGRRRDRRATPRRPASRPLVAAGRDLVVLDDRRARPARRRLDGPVAACRHP